MLRKSATAMAVLLGAALAAGPAEATMITFEFGGVVTSVQDPAGALGGGVHVNDAFSGTFTFDPATPDWMPSDPTYGGYDFTNGLMSLSVGSIAVSSNPAALHSISIKNDRYGSYDGFTMGSFTFDSGGLRVAELYVSLVDPTKAALDGDALLLVPPVLGDFSRREFSFVGQGGFNVQGIVTTLTPEPEALALVLFGGPILFRQKAKRLEVRMDGCPQLSGSWTPESEGVTTC